MSSGAGTAGADGAPQAEWRTQISEIREDIPYLYGYSLKDLAENDVDFAAVLLLAATGELPSKNASKMANAMLVILAAHGISPSGAVARIIAACGVPMQVSVGVSAMSMGLHHGGSGEQLAEALQAVRRTAAARGDEQSPSEESARLVVESFDGPLPGFGHPMHASGDPRATFLLDLADTLQVSGWYCALAHQVESLLEKRKGRPIPLNVTGATSAILSDLGVPWRFMRVFNVTARTPVQGAHAIEEIERERRWRMVAANDVEYDGVPPRSVPDMWLDD